MEASAVHAPTRLARLTSTPSLLRLRSDEQLVSLLRAGSHDAFRAIYERYGQRLFSYVRQMLGPGSRQDAEDVLQDVFTRTYTILKSDDREINLRPWLYRVAHNRCIDHLRRPSPVTAELVESSAKTLQDPFDEVQRREDLQRLVTDISRLPEQQKSALLLREINGLSYRELAETLDVTVPAVKSLLVRARVELVETVEARETSCAGVREELSLACDVRSSRPSPRSRRHLRDCAGCRDYQAGIRGMRRSFAALSPVAVFGPLAVAAKIAGIGGSGGGASATAGSSGGLAGGFAGGGLTAGTAGKIAAVVSTAAITAGGAVEIERRVGERTKAAPAAEAPAAGATKRTGSGSVAASGTGTTAGDQKRATANAPARRKRERTTGGGAADGPRARREPVRSARPNSPAATGQGAAGGAPQAGAGPDGGAGGGGAAGGGGGAGAGPDSPATGSPAAPVIAPELPAKLPDAPAVPVETPPAVSEGGAATPTVPAPPVEVPALPPVKDKVTGKLKPDKEIGPKPGRGPKVDVGL